jgi:hypothetical protein
MKKLELLFFSLAFILSGSGIYAQGELDNGKHAVEKVIYDLFDGMREADSSKVKALFSKDVQMYTSYTNKEGQRVLKKGELAPFLKAIGSPHDKIWDEKIWNTSVMIDGGIAQVWTDYAFYVGEEFSHCGVDAFHLAKDALGDWKILHLMDTRRKEGCVEPKK